MLRQAVRPLPAFFPRLVLSIVRYSLALQRDLQV